MAPPRWQPPLEEEPYLQWRDNRNSVRCLLCRDEGKSNAGGWISWKSLRGHLSTVMHGNCRRIRESRLETERQHRDELLEAQNAPIIEDYPPAQAYPASTVPAMFADNELDDLPAMDVDMRPSALHMMDQLGQTEREPDASPEEIRGALKQEFEDMLTAAMQEQHLGDGSEQEFTDEVMFDESQEDEDDNICFDLDVGETSSYFPYPNKTVMLLDVLDNMPRCRFTSAQMSLILHFAKKLGASAVPSLKGLRKVQKGLQDSCGYQPLKVVSPRGNIFYMNDVREVVARDFANPLVAPHLQLYVEERSHGISETYQAERVLEYLPEQLTPMFSNGHKRFWINELVQLHDGTYIIPETLIMREVDLTDGTRGTRLTTDARVVTRMADGRWNLTTDEITVQAEQLERDFMDILAEFGVLVWMEGALPPEMPNPMRKLVDDDEDLVVVMVTPWADDVSGNKSKQYNKHMNMYVQNSSLPGRLLQQEFHVQYISASPHASSAEQFAAFRDHVKATEKEPIPCYNAFTKKKCRCILRAPGLPADNPQQSEEASHIGGGNACHPCRKCHWGGLKIEKETPELYHECHAPGIARNAAEIRAELRDQLQLATRGDSKTIEARQKATGTKDKITDYWIAKTLAQIAEIKNDGPRATVQDLTERAQQWLDEQPGDKMNPLLDMTGLDPSQDTPVELLHTVLLGVTKYIWHFLHTSQWSDTNRHLLAIRLQSTDITGLHVPPLRASYMIQYKNNLIGKHFKTLMQVLAFHVHDICTPEQFTLVKAAGDLGARLWVPIIDDMELYLEDLKTAIANLLDAWDAVDPLRIIVKIKLHLLMHLPDDIRRFGPAVRFSTEVQEAYNAIFRMCSINSNHLSPSRDIAQKFASMNRVKHLLCGGFWQNQSSQAWIQPGETVQIILVDDPVFQRHLGWVTHNPIEAGAVKLAGLKANPPAKWQETKACLYWRFPDAPPALESEWQIGHSLTTQTGDRASKTCWVFADICGNNKTASTVLGRICEILSNSRSIVVLERFLCTEQRHPEFGWPVVRRPRGEEITRDKIESFVVVDSSSIRFVCSVQHDCRNGKCQPSVMGRERQEREDTNRDRSLIKHIDDDHFVLNMAGLHNFTEICHVLPPALTKLQPLHADREAFHQEVSRRAQLTGTQKRKISAEKRRATAARKREEAQKAAEAAQAAAAAAQQAEDDAEMDMDEAATDSEEDKSERYLSESEDEEHDIEDMSGDDEAPTRRRSQRLRKKRKRR